MLDISVRSFLKRYIKVEEIGEDVNLFEEGLVNSLFAMQLYVIARHRGFYKK